VPCVFKAPNPSPAPASSGTVLDLAAEAFATGNRQQAIDLTSLALKQNPTDVVAAYMARVIGREQEAEPVKTQAMR
jgi:hypothetical protein